MPIIGAKGSPSSQGFGQFAQSGTANYIEDVFSTYLYTGNGTTLSINNSIDLAGKGGMVWLKSRSNATNNAIFDTSRGAGYRIISDTTDAQNYSLNYVSSFDSTGFSLGGPSVSTNFSNYTYASWTFRKQPKFFDVVTYTGTGSLPLTINHNLGSIPGCIIVKSTSNATDWCVYHRSLGATKGMYLNTAQAAITTSGFWEDTAPTATTFNVGGNTKVNTSGATYVAYLFAHDAGGFGLTGTDNVITCGSFTTSAGGYSGIINLGFEPQWILLKATSTSDGWQVADIMRMMTATGKYVYLNPNLADVESGILNNTAFVNSTGFYMDNILGSTTYAYVAIRRGPMKVPTSGTSVFTPTTVSVSSTPSFTSNSVPDLVTVGYRPGTASDYPTWSSRLTGNTFLTSSSTAAENSSYPNIWTFNGQKTFGSTFVNSVAWMFSRAPSFFDEVCFTGDGTSSRAITHNLGVAPELIIVKTRGVADGWAVYQKDLPSGYYLELNTTSQRNNDATKFTTTAPTASTFNVGSGLNQSGRTFVAYLFSSCTGVSKVGSFTGTATTQNVNCGFTSGARFVLLKQAYPSTGDWYVWDSARGIVAGNDPYLLLNNTDAEVTNTDYVDTYSAGFQLSSTAPYAINGSGCQIIYLAIA